MLPLGLSILTDPPIRLLGALSEQSKVTIDKSLKIRRGAMSNRNVLTRVERIAKLEETDRWAQGDSVLGLPKVRVQKVSLKKKKKVKKDEDEEKTDK